MPCKDKIKRTSLKTKLWFRLNCRKARVLCFETRQLRIQRAMYLVAWISAASSYLCNWRHQLDLQVFGSLGQLAYSEVTEDKLRKWKWFSQSLRLHNGHWFFPPADCRHIHSYFNLSTTTTPQLPKLALQIENENLIRLSTHPWCSFCLVYISVRFNKHFFKMLHTPIKRCHITPPHNGRLYNALFPPAVPKVAL